MNTEDLNLFPNVNKAPKFESVQLNRSGGSLRTGTYYFALAYKIESLTNFFTVSQPVYVGENQSSTNYRGKRGDVQTNSSISLAINNIDVSFDKLKIAVIRYAQGVLADVMYLPEFDISGNTLSYTYTGGESVTFGALDEIVIDNPYYQTAKTVKFTDNVLYLGNLTKPVDIGYQKYANNIIAEGVEEEIGNIENLVSEEINNETYEISIPTGGVRSFMPGEVYAFYISFVLKNGSESKAYHIPGRESVEITNEGTKGIGSITIPDNFTNYNPNGESDRYQIKFTILGEIADTAPLGLDGEFNVKVQNQDVNISITVNDSRLDIIDKIINSLSNITNVETRTAFGSAEIDFDLPSVGVAESPTVDFINSGQGGIETLDDESSVLRQGYPSNEQVEWGELLVRIQGESSHSIPVFKGPNGTSQQDIAEAIEAHFNFNPDLSASISTDSGFKVTIETNNATSNFNGKLQSVWNPKTPDYEFTQIFRNITGGSDPGQPYNETDDVSEQNLENIANEAGATGKNFQFKDAPDILTNATFKKLSYWENENEQYPSAQQDSKNDFTDLNGHKVRHHKFPFTLGGIKGNTINKTGIKFSNIVIPNEIKDQVISYKIHYAKKDEQNKLIITSGLLGGFQKDIDNNPLNTVYNEKRNFTALEINGLNVLAIQLKNELPNIGNFDPGQHYYVYADGSKNGIYKFENNEWVKDEELTGPGGIINYFENQFHIINTDALSSFKNISAVNYLRCEKVLDGVAQFEDNRVGVQNYTSESNSSPINPFIEVKRKSYLESGQEIVNIPNSNNNYNTVDQSTAVLFETETISRTLGHKDYTFAPGNIAGLIYELEALYANALTYTNNLFLSFTGQQLVECFSAPINGNELETDDIYNGDAYVGVDIHKIFTRNIISGDSFATSIYKSANIITYPLISWTNTIYREEGDNLGETLFPNTTAERYVFPVEGEQDRADARKYDNYFVVNPDYNKVNNIKQADGIYNYRDSNINAFPNRIIRSDTITDREQYRTFRVGEQFDIQREFGEINKLELFNKNLLIHCERALLNTRGKQRIATNLDEVFVGSGDIFQVLPEELISTPFGFGGLQDPYHSLVTEFGYFFMDVEASKLYKYTDQIAELSSKQYGLSKTLHNVNDFKGLGFDPIEKRMLFSFKSHDVGPATLSFSIDLDAFISFHDYYPDNYLGNLRNLYVVKDSILYMTGYGNRGKYFNNDQQPMIVEWINTSPEYSRAISIIFIGDRLNNFESNESQQSIQGNYEVKNSYQETGVVPLSVYPQDPSGNVRRTARHWLINRIRTNDSDWFNKDKLTDKYNKVRLELSNNGNNLLYLTGFDLLSKDKTR